MATLGRLICIAVAAVGTVAGPAIKPVFAQARADIAKAQQAFELARRCYALADWPCALHGFDDAYRLSGDPVLLFNRAQTLRQMGRRSDAISAYRSFLRERPEAENRALVEEKIRALQSQETPASSAPSGSDMLDPFAPTSQTAPSGVVTTREQAPAHRTPLRQWLPWALGGLTVALAGGATVAGLSTNARYDALRASCGTTSAGCSDAELRQVSSRASLTNVLWAGAALAAVGTGFAFWYSRESTGVQVAVRW